MQGDFGISLRQSEKVSSLIQARLPATLELSLVAAILALVVGLPLGGTRRCAAMASLAQLVLAGSLLGYPCPPS